MSKTKESIGIFIDAKNNRLTHVVIKDHTDISRIAGYKYFDCVGLNTKGKVSNTLFVDDEGLINGTQWGFEITTSNGEPRGQYAGNGIILGTNKQGESVDATLSLEDAAKRVRCFTRTGDTAVWLAKNPEVRTK